MKDMHELYNGTLYSSVDAPHVRGVYAMYRGDELLYIGYAGREDHKPGNKSYGIFDRMDSYYWSGSLGSDFLGYLAMRLLKEGVLSVQLDGTEASIFKRLSDATKQYARDHIRFRYVQEDDKRTVRHMEKTARAGLTGPRPAFNPI
jgi:hypothetical protein